MYYLAFGWFLAGNCKQLGGWFWPRGFCEVVLRCWPGLLSSEGLMGLEDWLPHIADRLVLALVLTGWQGVSVPLHLGLSRRHLECPRDMEADFPQSGRSKREQGRKLQGLLCHIRRSHTLSLSQYPVGFTGPN